MKVSVSNARAVQECAQRPRRTREEEADDADSSSDADIIDDVLGTAKVVDTDDEKSAGSLASSESDDFYDFPFEEDIIAKPLKPDAAATRAEEACAAATGAPRLRRAGFEPFWSDPYFSVWGHPNSEFVKIAMRDVWRSPAPEGMGTANSTKQVTPRHYQEKCDDPIRSLLLLRAWGLWRARQGGWANAQRGRARHFREQEVLLEGDVKALGSKCRLLGDHKANSMLKSWVPDIVARLRD